ncbi:MAG: hypothetical protein CM1200mP36_07150 [Gammaproteobacteria bacterium]|nr:MAG: hypothetical protein CM1200mP36_07150 [Gammaproteobacteria bacterium]
MLRAQAIRQLDNALQAMDRAQAQSAEDPEQTQRAIEQARRQLDRALEQMTAQRQAAAEEVFSDLRERSQDLLDDQRQLAAELQQVAREALENRDDDGVRESPLDDDEAIELAERKREMQRELEALEQDIQEVSQRFRGQTPGASEELNNALSDLQQTQVERRLAYAAEMIRRGLADELAPFEGIVTTALDDLRRDTESALTLASREAREGQQMEQDPTSELVAELQALRRSLPSCRTVGLRRRAKKARALLKADRTVVRTRADSLAVISSAAVLVGANTLIGAGWVSGIRRARWGSIRRLRRSWKLGYRKPGVTFSHWARG